MKKIIFVIIMSLFMIGNAKAATASITATSNKSQVIVGETVTVTVKVSSSEYLGSWRFDVVPSSNLTFVSSTPGGLYVVDSVDSLTQKTKTYTFTFKAKSSGTGSVVIKNSTVYSLDEKLLTPSNGSTSFKMLTQAELYATYSKNNYLASLKVDGYEISPSFNKDTLVYNLELENGTESITISGTKDDSKSTIKGLGKVNLIEGLNTFSIVVTAQNGSTKAYTLNVTVKELKPIEVTLDGNTYTVIRKSELLPKSNIYYQPTTISIDDEDVPAYYNEVSGITLVGLNLAGESKLYMYENGKYLNYQELGLNQMYIMPMSLPTMDESYGLSKVDIGTYSVAAYTKEGYPYPIIYAMNIENGEKSFYSYDSKENTIQLFKEVKIETKEDLYFLIIISLFGFIVLTYLILVIVLIVKNIKNKKKIDTQLD